MTICGNRIGKGGSIVESKAKMPCPVHDIVIIVGYLDHEGSGSVIDEDKLPGLKLNTCGILRIPVEAHNPIKICPCEQKVGRTSIRYDDAGYACSIKR